MYAYPVSEQGLNVFELSEFRESGNMSWSSVSKNVGHAAQVVPGRDRT